MFLAYFDESGDTGLANSPSTCFVLAGILVSDRNWLPALDATLQFRRFLKDEFEIKLSDELKAVHLLKCKGPFEHISPRAALRIYEMSMRFQAKCGLLRTFAIVIDKSKIQQPSTNIRETAWRYAIERIERLCAKGDGRAPPLDGHAMLFPDEGYGEYLKKMVRKHRRHHYVPSAFGDEALERPASNIIEDPFHRSSRESYFVQLADLNAYAAYRHLAPTSRFGSHVWDLLGAARIEQVNQLTRGRAAPRPCGIVNWPT